MIRIFTAVAVIFALIVPSVSAAQQYYPIIAFDSAENLYECLDRITNEQQLRAASDGSIVRGGNCTFAVAPAGQFSAMWVGFHQTSTFIFPVFELDYDRDSLRRFSNDGIFRHRDWRISTAQGSNDCSRQQLAVFDGCLVPRSCEVFQNFPVPQPGRLSYVSFPLTCTRFRG